MVVMNMNVHYYQQMIFTYLIDMLLSRPSEAAGIVAAEHKQRGVIGVRCCRKYGSGALGLFHVWACANRVHKN